MTPRTRTRSLPTPLRTPQRAVGLFLGAAVLVVLLVAPSLATTPFVPRLTVDNPTAFDLNIDVTGADRDGSIALGTVARGTQRAIEEIADQGATWVVRFSYGGIETGELVVARSDLQAADWRLSIPPAMGEALAGAGAVPSAR